MSGAADPLQGLSRPLGDPAAMQALGSRFVAGSEALAQSARALRDMVGRLLAQAWSGQAATACAAASAQNAAMVGMAATAYQLGGGVLNRYAGRLAAAQADYDAARRLADQAVEEERSHDRANVAAAASGGPVLPVDLFWTSPLRLTAQSRAEQAAADARAAGQQAAAALEQTLAPFRPAPRRKPQPESHWYSPVTGFLGGVYDSVKDPVVMAGGLVGLHGDVSDNWAALGSGLAHGVTHPLDLGKAVIDWQDLSEGHYAHWGGELLPSIAAAVFTGGGAAAVKGADAVSGVSRAGKALSEMSDAEKASVLARGEAFTPGAVGLDATKTKFLTPDGRLDYARAYESELQNFREIGSSGAVTLDRPRYLVNLHDGSARLGPDRSLKWATTPDTILEHSRGGALQRLALVPEWGKRTHLSVIRVPEGSTIHVAEGPAAAQVSHSIEHLPRLPTGMKVGGGHQVLFRDFDRSWVVWSGEAPWPGTGQALVHGAAVGTRNGLVVRAPDVLADLGQGGTG